MFAHMKQLVCLETGRLSLLEVPIPQLQDGDLLVQMKACGICGTDLMKVYDETVAKPVQLGHEIVGTVSESRSPLFSTGQRIAVAHHAPDEKSHYSTRGSETQDPEFKRSNVDPGGFAEFIRVPANLVPHTVHRIPDGMHDLRAVFMEPLACCLRALERVKLVAGDTVLLVGAGAIGLLFVPLLVSRGITVIAADVRADRLELARAWGASDAIDTRSNDVVKPVNCRTGGRGADCVILTAVTQSTMALASSNVRDGGWIVPFGVKPNTLLPLNLWDYYRREVSLVTSYSATPAGLKQAIEILASDAFAFENTITDQIGLSDGGKAFDQVHRGQSIKVAVMGSNHA
jgi:L-iditol 2-dehydrogenase